MNLDEQNLWLYLSKLQVVSFCYYKESVFKCSDLKSNITFGSNFVENTRAQLLVYNFFFHLNNLLLNYFGPDFFVT